MKPESSTPKKTTPQNSTTSGGVTAATGASASSTLPVLAPLPALAEFTATPPLHTLLQDPKRNAAMQIQACGLQLDFSRQRLSQNDFQTLMAEVEPRGITALQRAMFAGQPINTSENRPVLHVALRGSGQPAPPWGTEVDLAVATELKRMLDFAEQAYRGQLHGASGKPITDILNLGIGGSDLGPRMATAALAHYADTSAVRVHYISNPDAWELHTCLRQLDPERTLCIFASKTLTTQETLTNAASVRRWQADAGMSEQAMSAHWVAVTANRQAAAQHYPNSPCFYFWDWVGGRYSLWSALGLPLAMAIGASQFRQLLAGAQAMDAHFLNAPPAQNMPMVLGMTGAYNRCALSAPSYALACYAGRLKHFTPFIQQMDMESNGKSCDRAGHLLPKACTGPICTGPVVWGGLGIDGQHAYFQLLHQGSHLVPMEFIGVRSEDSPLPLAAEHLRVSNTNLQAQAQAFALGRNAAALGLPEHRHYAGNVPSHILWLERLDPHTLGALIALYEHKVFVQGALWGINSYDQWGVELGKEMVKQLEAAGR